MEGSYWKIEKINHIQFLFKRFTLKAHTAVIAGALTDKKRTGESARLSPAQ